MAKAMAASDDDGDTLWRSTAGARGRARERRPVRARASLAGVGDIPPGTTRWYMGRTIRGGPARKIKACTARYYNSTKLDTLLVTLSLRSI